jgi:hypothetical protein
MRAHSYEAVELLQQARSFQSNVSATTELHLLVRKGRLGHSGKLLNGRSFLDASLCYSRLLVLTFSQCCLRCSSNVIGGSPASSLCESPQISLGIQQTRSALTMRLSCSSRHTVSNRVSL